MKHLPLMITFLLLTTLAAACAPATPAPSATPDDLILISSLPAFTPTADETAIVAQLLLDFGARLQQVSLLAPDAGDQIRAQYAAFVAPDLLAAWAVDPQNAPGRLTSSPWPDHIEVLSVEPDGPGRYAVRAYLVFATSDDPQSSRDLLLLTVAHLDAGWRIVAYLELSGTD